MAELQPLLALPTPALRTLLEEGGLQPGVSTADVSSPAEWLVDPFECAVALTYDASMGAFSRRGTIVLCRREPTEDGTAERWRVSNPIVPSAALELAADVTALVWLRPHVPEHTVGGPFLAVGTSSGHLLIYGRDGRVVLKQLIDKDPILQIKFRPVSQHSGSDGSSDLSLRLPQKLVHIDGADLCELLARQQSDYGTIEEQGPPYLPHRKWNLRDQTLTTDVVCCGRMPAQLTEIVPEQVPPYQLLAAGKDPCLTVYAGHGNPSIFPGFGTLAAKGVAAVANLAKSFWSWDPEPDAAGSSEYKPPPLERAVGVRPADGGVLHDPTRRLERLELDPSSRLVAGTDAFGRVMLIDVAAYPPVVTRLWKGYREAQVVWLHQEELGTAAQPSVPAALLAIYLPRRGLLEVWPAAAGDRLAALSVGKELRLISATSGRLGVERGGATGQAALPRQPSSGLRPWFACQCLLVAPDGSLSNLVVQADTGPPIPASVPSNNAETSRNSHAVLSLDDQAKEQVVYRNFLHHVACGDGEDVLLKAIASINGPQALLSALKAIAESQPSHSRLNWKAASVAVMELEFAHKRNPSGTALQLLHALKRRERLLRAYCVLSGEADADDAMTSHQAVSCVTHLWGVDQLRSERLWLLKYSTDIVSGTEGSTHSPAVNCISFLQCFPSLQGTPGGGLVVDSVGATRFVSRVLFKPLVGQGDEATGDDELAVQRVRSAVALLDLAPAEVWRLFAEWFIQQPLVGKSGHERETLFGNVDSGTAGRKVIWYLDCLGPEGSGSAVQICHQSPRLGHILALVATCAAMNLQPDADGESWNDLLGITTGAWELHKLLSLVARHKSLPIEGYAQTSSLTRLTSTLQLQLGDAERHPLHAEIDDSYLRRIEPGSPLARRAAFITICSKFPRHTVPSMLDMHAAVVLASQWGGEWVNHADLGLACDLLENLGHRAPAGASLNPLQLAIAQAVGAMLIWQRFCRDIVCQVLRGLEVGNGFPFDEATNGTVVHENLAIFGRMLALFDPVRIAERKLSLGTDVHNIMEKLDNALSDAPLIDASCDAVSDAVESTASQSQTQTDSTKAQAFRAFGLADVGCESAAMWLPVDIPDEFMGPTDFAAAAARVSACDRRLHAEYCTLLPTLAAMSAHNITDPKPSALFRFQYMEDESGSPFTPLDGTEQGDSPRTSNQRYARERLVHSLIGSNDLPRALELARLFGHDCEKVRLQWILRAYEMASEGDLEQELIDSIEDRYKLGVGLLTVARQRLARVLLAAQDRVEEQAAEERQRAEHGRKDGGKSRPPIVSKIEKQENELLHLMQSKLAQKQVRAGSSLRCIVVAFPFSTLSDLTKFCAVAVLVWVRFLHLVWCLHSGY